MTKKPEPICNGECLEAEMDGECPHEQAPEEEEEEGHYCPDHCGYYCRKCVL